MLIAKVGEKRFFTCAFFRGILRVLNCLCICSPAGDGEHRPLRDALHLPALWGQGLCGLHTLWLLPRHRPDQAEEDCDGARAGRSVAHRCVGNI